MLSKIHRGCSHHARQSTGQHSSPGRIKYKTNVLVKVKLQGANVSLSKTGKRNHSNFYSKASGTLKRYIQVEEVEGNDISKGFLK
jgi:hypothetical protein